MDSLTASTQIEDLDSLLPLLEEARHEEALPLIENKLSKQPDVALWKYLKALVVACQSRGAESVTLLYEVSQIDGFKTGFGLPPDVNTLAKASALNHLLFETTVEPRAREPWRHLEQVAKFLRNEEFQDRAVLGAWKSHPEDPNAPRQFIEHFGALDVDQRISLIEEILEDKPNSCIPRALLGHFMQERGKTALAIRHLKKAQECDPRAWHPHLYLGQVYFGQGRFDEAEKCFHEAIALREQTSAELLVNVALCQRATYRYDEAVETFFTALEQDTIEFHYWDELFEISQATGNAEQLMELLQKVAQQHPDQTELTVRIVELALHSNDPLQAERQLKNAGVLSDPNKNHALTLLAYKTLSLLGRHQITTALLESAVETAPKDKKLRCAYGYALLSNGRGQEAETVLKTTAANHPNEPDVQIAWGKALIAIGQYEKAYRVFSLASRLDPNGHEALAEQGHAQLHLGHLEEAVTLLKESTKKTEPPASISLLGLGSVYEHKGLMDISKDFYRQALTRDSGNIGAGRGWLRVTYKEHGEVKEGFAEMLQERASDFERCQIYLTLLESVLTEGLSETAKLFDNTQCEQLKETFTDSHYRDYLDESTTELLCELAQRLEESGDTEQARGVWRLATTWDNPELVERSAAELVRLDSIQPDEAREPEAPEEPIEEAVESIEQVSLEIDEETGDDPLLSLLSATLPVDAAPVPSEPLVEAEAPLEVEPISELETEPIFEPEPVQEPEAAAEPEAVAEPEVIAEAEAEAAAEPEAVTTTEAVLESEPEPEAGLEPTAIGAVTTEAPEEAPPLTEPVDPPLEAEEEVALATPPSTEATLVEPQTEANVPVTEPSEQTTEIPTGKDLLPIMAVDFEPLTRRQLHFHEALAQNQTGLVAPEALAHLILSSALGNEPPDPSTTDPESQTEAWSQALLSSAQELLAKEQYRGASRLLKTALLYAPESTALTGALTEVHSKWAEWLTESNEFAHAVALVRDGLRRDPESTELEKQLEAIYHRWMEWSQESGDPAASDLLAIYLRQESASLESFRSAFIESRQKRAQAASATPAPVVPEVAKPEPVVAETTPVPEATPVKAEEPEPVAVETTPEPEAAPVKVEEPKPAAAAVAPTGSSTYSTAEEAFAALVADPTNEAIGEAVFEQYANNLRTLTTALRTQSAKDPKQPMWLLLLARAFRRSGSETMAVIQYQKYIKAAPSPEAYEELAATYEEIGKEDFAKMTRRKAERAFPG